MSNDIDLNPGPNFDNFFNFMSWNVNSLAKDNCQRVRLIEVQNSICETSLNDSVEIPKTLINFTPLCLLIFQLTIDVVGWVFSLKILLPL